MQCLPFCYCDFRETSICNNGCIQIQRRKPSIQKLRGERIKALKTGGIYDVIVPKTEAIDEIEALEADNLYDILIAITEARGDIEALGPIGR